MKSKCFAFSLLETVVAVIISGVLMWMLLLITSSSTQSLRDTNLRVIGLDQMSAFNILMRSVIEKAAMFSEVEGGYQIQDQLGNTFDFLFLPGQSSDTEDGEFVLKVLSSGAEIEKTWLNGLDETVGFTLLFFNNLGQECSASLSSCEVTKVTVELKKIKHNAVQINSPIVFSASYPVYAHSTNNERLYSIATLPKLLASETE